MTESDAVKAARARAWAADTDRLRRALARTSMAVTRLLRAPGDMEDVAQAATLAGAMETGLQAVMAPERMIPADKLVNRADDLLRAVLMFHRGGGWTSEDHDEWVKLVGDTDATTRALCDAIREHLRSAEHG